MITKHTRWTLALVTLLVPCRDAAGRVVALKVRRRDPCDGARYLYVTSAPAGGPAALAAVHVPVEASELRAASPLVVTEGELKADVSCVLARLPVVSVPGVGSWRAALDVVRAWTPRPAAVAVAFDSDARTKPDVARASRALLEALRGEGFGVRAWQWPPDAGKGLDDFLRARLAARSTPDDRTP